MWKLVRSEEIKLPKMCFCFKKLTGILRGDQGNREGSFVNFWRRTRWVGLEVAIEERERSRSSRKNKARIGSVRTLRIYYDKLTIVVDVTLFLLLFFSLSDGEN